MAKFNPDSTYHNILLSENQKKFGLEQAMYETMKQINGVGYGGSMISFNSRVNLKKKAYQQIACGICGEMFTRYVGRKRFCAMNSKGENCAAINKLIGIYKRRQIIKDEAKISDREREAV